MSLTMMLAGLLKGDIMKSASDCIGKFRSSEFETEWTYSINVLQACPRSSDLVLGTEIQKVTIDNKNKDESCCL